MQLESRPDQAPAMIDDVGVLELHGRGTGNGVQGLARGVGDQVQVYAVARHVSENSGDNRFCHQPADPARLNPGTNLSIA
jgi:hypothetical protein